MSINNNHVRSDGSFAPKALLSMAPPLPFAEAGLGASILVPGGFTCPGMPTIPKSNPKTSTNTTNKGKIKSKKKTNQLVQETIPLNDIRRTYPRLVEALLNRGQVDDIESKLSSICINDSSFLLIINAIEKENPFGPIYQEIHGIQAASRCINAYFSAIPDSVFAILDSKFYKRSTGSEIHCNYSFSGSIIHRIVIEDIEQTMDINNAIVGLQTLAQVALDREYLPTSDGINAAEEMEDEETTNEPIDVQNQESNEDESDELQENPTDSTPSPTSNTDADSPPNSQKESESTPSSSANIPNESGNKRRFSFDQQELVVPTGKKRLSVGEVDFFVDKNDNFVACDQLIIATNKTKFKIGERMQSSRSFTTNGKIIFSLNADKRVQKLEVTYSSKLATQSSKYIDESMIDR